MRGMTLRAMTEACNGVYYGNEANLEKEVSDITTDSRKVTKEACLLRYVEKEQTDTSILMAVLKQELSVLYQKKNFRDRKIHISG